MNLWKKDKILFENTPYYVSPDIKKRKAFKLNSNSCLVINTNHCRGEYSLIKHVIKVNGWKETSSVGKGLIFWYGNSLNETDK